MFKALKKTLKQHRETAKDLVRNDNCFFYNPDESFDAINFTVCNYNYFFLFIKMLWGLSTAIQALFKTSHLKRFPVLCKRNICDLEHSVEEFWSAMLVMKKGTLEPLSQWKGNKNRYCLQ